MAVNLDAVSAGAVALLGVPSDRNSSLLRGAAAAPPAIRSVLFDPELNLGTEDGGNLAREPRFVDAGDAELAMTTDDPEAIFSSIVEAAGAVLDRGVRVLALGGDHAVTYPLVKAHADRRPPFSIVQIDAHPDLYDDIDGNPYSHASGFARIMERNLVAGLVQIGIRASTPHQRSQAERFGVRTVDLRDDDLLSALPDGPVYLSLDLDGLDPAFAPGVVHPEPGGLSTRQAIRIVQSIPGPLIGADVVELNPRRDINGLTALVAAKLVKEIAARMLRG
jgi:agmatinase